MKQLHMILRNRHQIRILFTQYTHVMIHKETMKDWLYLTTWVVYTAYVYQVFSEVIKFVAR